MVLTSPTRSYAGRFSSRLVLTLVVGSSLAVACTPKDPTQLVVVLRTDLRVPDELDEVRVELLNSAEMATDTQIFRLGDRADRHRLPASFGIAPRDGDVERQIHLRIAARQFGADLFQTEVRTHFVPNRTLRLDVYLAHRCVLESCPESETCRRRGCVPIDVDESTLPDFEPGDELLDAGPSDRQLDAGDVDAGDVDAGDVDAGDVDAGDVDAGDVDAGEVDAGVSDAGVDGGSDAGVSDAGVDGGSDAGGSDAGVDGGSDAGPFDAGGATFIIPTTPTPCSGSSCGAGFICRGDFGGPLLCRADCRMESVCGGAGSLCDASDHCTHPCDPFTNEGCPSGSVCGLSLTASPPLYAPVMHVTVCRAETPGGTDGALCDDTGIGGHADCAAQHYCVSGRCRQICLLSGPVCPAGTCVSLRDVEAGERGLLLAAGEIGRCM